VAAVVAAEIGVAFVVSIAGPVAPHRDLLPFPRGRGFCRIIRKRCTRRRRLCPQRHSDG
jgi:hypothetical protein